MGHAGTLLCRNTATLDPTTREENSLNNNSNRNNNRRRGRGNRNQGGGGNNSNRIDSRARGNAPQLLDKYKKLAQDAQHNGDRVQAEYYLQFADHYFRVIADNKARQDEQRAKRDDNRGGKHGSDDDDDDRRDDHDNDGRDDRPKKPRRSRKNEGQEAQGREQNEGSDADGEENPFVAKRKPAKAKANGKAKPAKDNGPHGLDPSALPPAIGDDANEAPKPRRRTRRAASEDGEEAAA